MWNRLARPANAKLPLETRAINIYMAPNSFG
jgi:hypothetical protein